MKREDNLPNNLDFMNAYEVRDYLKIPLSTLYDLTKSGRIKAIKIGKCWRYSRIDIERYSVFGTGKWNKIPLIPEEISITEKRANPRINCSMLTNLKVIIPEKKEIICRGRIVNIGVGGVFIEDCNNNNLFSGIRIDDPIILEFHLDDLDYKDITIGAKGRVLRLEDKGVAVKFRKISRDVREMIAGYVG